MSGTWAQLTATIERIDRGRALKRALLMGEKSNWWVPYAQPLLDAISLFEELRIRYALAGGIAAMYYGRARFTEDVDFVMIAGHVAVLEAHPDVMEKHHFDPTCCYKLYHQSGVEVDLWRDDFGDQIVQRALSAELAGRSVQVVEAHDLIAMKLRAGRIKDDYDVSEILKSQAIDESRLRSLVKAEEFQHYLQIKNRTSG